MTTLSAPESLQAARASSLAAAPDRRGLEDRAGDRPTPASNDVGAEPMPRSPAALSAVGPRKNSDAAHNVAWNFGVASLYNAAMFPIFRARRSPPARAAAAVGRPRSLWNSKCLAPVALFSSMALASTADAQPPSQPAPPASDTSAAPAKAKSTSKPAPGPNSGKSGKSSGSKSGDARGGNKVISLDDEFLVEGKLEKPSAFYVLRRSATDYDWARLDAVFTPLVLESVQDPLF